MLQRNRRDCRGQLRVSVPFRGLCSEIARNVDRLAEVLRWFPSPFGVCVLKKSTSIIGYTLAVVSVPFRGLCSEILMHIDDMNEFMYSFRPLSGFLF